MPGTRPVFIVGDVHGHLEQLLRLLHNAGLVNNGRWSGADAQLWLMGDYVDRGPNGLEVIELVMQLQHEAAAAGGSVGALLGNHELFLLAVQRFGEQPTSWGSTYRSDWLRNGGVVADLEGLTPKHIAWLSELPGMTSIEERLLIHADATFYEHYGRSVADVNNSFQRILASNDVDAWDQLIEDFCQRRAFTHAHVRRVDPAAQFLATQFLNVFGGRQIIHGHTPIPGITKTAPEAITEPLIYASGLCVNVDGGIYQGGPGFVYQLPPLANA